MGKLLDILGLGSGKKNFYVRDFRNAYQLRPDNNPPRFKFEGYVNFIINRKLLDMMYPETQTAEFRTQVSSLVRTASLPAVEFKTEVKNKYNSKKIVQTGVEYKPVSITVLDTVGNEWLTLFMKYYSFYYMNARNKQTDGDRDISDSQSLTSIIDVSSKFGSPSFDSNASGLALNRIKNFFERIDYVMYHGERAVQYSLINPVLKNFDPGDLDYSSSDLLEFKLDFEYENFTIYNETNFVMTDFDLGRFENAAELEGPAFVPGRRPISIDKPVKLGTLGSKGTPFGREEQIQVSTRGGVDTADKDAIVVQGTSKTALPSTYNKAVNLQTAQQSGGENGGWFSNLLKGAASNALTAAINGQSVKNAVLGTVVGAAVNATRPGVAATRGTVNQSSGSPNSGSNQVKPGG